MRSRGIWAVGISALGILGVAALGAGAHGQSLAPRAALVPEWTALFTRTEGWTGADGIYAIPLNGYEGPGRSAQGKTLFVFSDTFVGSVDATGKRVNSTMVNNSLAILDGARPDPSKIRFLWGRDAQGRAAAAFTPKTPKTLALAAAGGKAWYWLQDGFVHKGHLYNFPLIVESNPEAAEGWQFKETGIALLKVPLDGAGEPDLAKTVQFDTPLFGRVGGGNVYYGCGILVNTVEAGAPSPDGYVYVYGRNGLHVSRVKPDEVEDFTAWRVWDGAGWNPDFAKAASLGLGGPELSVMPVYEGALQGKYLLVSSGVEPDIFARVADHPWGPFGNRVHLFKAPEWDPTLPVYTYNAKAHPTLSAGGTWLVTYNVNTSNWNANLAKADIYHPRFFAFRFDPGEISGTLRPLRMGSWGASEGFRFSGGGMPTFEAQGRERPMLLRADGRFVMSRSLH